MEMMNDLSWESTGNYQAKCYATKLDYTLQIGLQTLSSPYGQISLGFAFLVAN